MALILGSSMGLYFSLDWRWRSPQEDQIQHSLFQSERAAYPKVEVDFGRWRAFVGPYHYYEPEDTRYDVKLGYFDFGFGKALTFPLGFEAYPYAALGLGVANSDWGTLGPQTSKLGPVFFFGGDLAWGPLSWHAKALLSTGYRVIPGWFPGTLHHQWELGLGFRFGVWGD